MNNKIRQIINEWDIAKKDVKQIYDSAWQIGEDFVLKTYEDVNMLQRNIKILTILEDMGIPVGGIVLTKDKKTYAIDNEYYYILTNKLSGSNIADVHENTAIASEMGRVLARLHKAFKECETQDEFWDNSLLKEMNGWIKDVWVKNNWKYIDESEFGILTDRLEKLYDKLPVQLIHRDVHLGNFLFENGKFSGYIDFDLSQRNIRIFDLCYFMLGLLSKEEVLEISEEQWFDILKYFFAGYEQEHKLLPEEKQAVPYVMEAIELLFVAWFIEQNDIKCAEDAMKIYQFAEKNVERILKVIQ
jgi:Ser/Thr protein kinase RdoA (MazF antagonist)